jgi:hypothetical protein
MDVNVRLIHCLDCAKMPAYIFELDCRLRLIGHILMSRWKMDKRHQAGRMPRLMQ